MIISHRGPVRQTSRVDLEIMKNILEGIAWNLHRWLFRQTLALNRRGGGKKITFPTVCVANIEQLTPRV